MNPYAAGAGAGDDRRYSLLPNFSSSAHSAAPPLHGKQPAVKPSTLFPPLIPDPVSHSAGFTGNLSTVPPSPSLHALESSRKLEEEVRRELDPLRARAMAERLYEVQLLGLLPPTANGIPRMPPVPEPTLGHGSYLLPYRSPYPTSHRNDIEDRVAVPGPSPSYSVSDPSSDEEYPPKGGLSELRPSRKVQEKMEKIKKMFGQEVLAAPLEEKEAPPPAAEHCYRCGRDGHVLINCNLSNQDILGYNQQGMNGNKKRKKKRGGVKVRNRRGIDVFQT